MEEICLGKEASDLCPLLEGKEELEEDEACENFALVLGREEEGGEGDGEEEEGGRGEGEGLRGSSY